MTTEEQVTNVTTTEANATVETQATTQDQAPEVNARLLEESKKNKKAAQEYRTKLETLEKERLTEQQRYKELYEKSEEKYQGLYKSLVKEKVRAAVATKAQAMGVVDIDAAMLLGNKELLQVEEDSLEVHGVDTFMDELKKAKPYLFQVAQKANINGVTPNAVLKSNTKPLKELTVEEIKAQLKALGK